jgi:hypothetical protein
MEQGSDVSLVVMLMREAVGGGDIGNKENVLAGLLHPGFAGNAGCASNSAVVSRYIAVVAGYCISCFS